MVALRQVGQPVRAATFFSQDEYILTVNVVGGGKAGTGKSSVGVRYIALARFLP